jgi:hypothetical protein
VLACSGDIARAFGRVDQQHAAQNGSACQPGDEEKPLGSAPVDQSERHAQRQQQGRYRIEQGNARIVPRATVGNEGVRAKTLAGLIDEDRGKRDAFRQFLFQPAALHDADHCQARGEGGGLGDEMGDQRTKPQPEPDDDQWKMRGATARKRCRSHSAR